MKYLNENQITELILDYIDGNIYKYAVLIDGAWGSGKTYFAKEVLAKEIEEHEQKRKVKTRAMKDENYYIFHFMAYQMRQIFPVNLVERC